MTTDNNHNDLDWLAFCYAAGELDPLQVEQFEARLTDDQEARDDGSNQRYRANNNDATHARLPVG